MASSRNNNGVSSPARPTARSTARRVARGTDTKRAGTVRTASRVSASTRSRRATASAAARQTNFMKYAADNRVVQAVYAFTTTYRPLFIALVAAALAVGIYFPVRDFYIAHRTQNILQAQLDIRKKYNDSLGKEVDQYLSQEGIEDAARKNLGMAMPGEKTITVEGLDKDGNPIVKQSEGTDEATTDGAAGDADSQNGQSSATATDDEVGTDTADEADDKKEDSGKLKGADAADKSKTGSASDSAADSDKDPTTSAEAEAAERAVLENSPWYWKLLDTIFFFDGSNGMAVTSTGEQTSDSTSE